MTSSDISYNTVPQFFWRRATINSNVSYKENLHIAPFNILNGQIYSWSQTIYIDDFSPYCIPIFNNNFNFQERFQYYEFNQIDSNGLYWKCSEEDAKTFLAEKYPEIHNKYLDS